MDAIQTEMILDVRISIQAVLGDHLKAGFLTSAVVYVTVQSYDPGASKNARYIAETIDAGEAWQELPITFDTKFTE